MVTLSGRHRRLALLPVGLMLSTALGAFAFADDFVVSSTTTQTNGGNAIDGNDTLTITADGQITTSGDRGVLSSGGNNRIENYGTVSVSGDFLEAIHNEASAGTVIVNSGSVTAAGLFTYGISNSNSGNVRITNNDTVTTSGGASYAIYNDNSDGAELINNGLVKTTGSDSHAIYSNNSSGVRIENHGTIETTNSNSAGIYNRSSLSDTDNVLINFSQITTHGQGASGMVNEGSPGAEVSNAGSIVTEANVSHGIVLSGSDSSEVSNSGEIAIGGNYANGINVVDSDFAQLSNTGTIVTSGSLANGIAISGSTGWSLLNSGTIVSAQGSAITASGTGSSVTLTTAGYLGGAIDFTSSGIALAIEADTPSHSVLWQLPDNMEGDDPEITGSGPWFYNATTKQFATYDARVLGAGQAMLGDLTLALSELGSGADSGYWISGFGGGFASSDGDTELSAGQGGLVFGYNADRGAEPFSWAAKGGVFGTGFDATDGGNDGYTVDGKGFFAGLNGRQRFGALAFDFGLVAGYLGSDQSRFINDNLAETDGLTLGESWAEASYGGWFVAPEIGVSSSFAFDQDWAITPSARLRYAGQWTEAYTETGATANASVDGYATGMFEVSGELELARTFDAGRFNVRVGLLSRLATGDDAVDVSLLGQTESVELGSTDSSAVYAGLGLDLSLDDRSSLSFAATGYAGDVFGGTAEVKLARSF